MSIRIVTYESTTAAGLNCAALDQALSRRVSGLRLNDYPGSDINTWIGRIPQLDAVDDLGRWQSRNNALAVLGWQQGSVKQTLQSCRKRFAPERIGLIMGSSTSSIDRTEAAYADLNAQQQIKAIYQQPQVHHPGALNVFMAHLTGIQGPSLTINTACSSSAKVFAAGARWLASGLVDAVLVGGVDTLCLTVLYGFHALQLVSAEKCKPFDQARDGINLGEAAGYAVLLRACDAQGFETAYPKIQLSGYGESSDAHHMSHPHPEGLGAQCAIDKALKMAGLTYNDIEHINCHGTSSRANDLIEGNLLGKLFPKTTRCTSTKAWMGHTLGAAGITEAIIAMRTLSTGLIPGTLNLSKLDSALDFTMDSRNHQVDGLQHVMSNSFGFGGNNCCLIFSHAVDSSGTLDKSV